MRKIVLAAMIVAPITGAALAQNSKTFSNYISGLPNATIPFTGNEVTYVLQGGVSKKTPVGGSISGPSTSIVGNLATWNSTAGSQLVDASVTPIASSYQWNNPQFFNVSDPANFWFGTQQLDAMNIQAFYDNSIVILPGFNQANALDISLVAFHGNYLTGGLSDAKTTFIGNQINESFNAQGQRVLQTGALNCYGIGDCSLSTWFITAATYPRAGDEGLGFQLVSRLGQVTPVQTLTVTGVSRNTCNTTTTGSISGSASSLTVGVVSGAGCTAGTWVVVNHEAATGFVNHEAVQIISSTTSTITAVFASNQNSGVTITPAVDLTYSGSGGVVGEGRVLVDTTASPYTTGTVTSITTNGGAQFVGSGTGWGATSMLVGGTTIVPGCISLAADDYTSSPYGAGVNALHDWYQIQSVGGTTNLNILSFSSAGAQNYKGKGPGNGSYTIRPCAEVLRVLSTNTPSFQNGGEAILDTNSFAWATNDVLDISLPPYPDVTGFQWNLNFYSNGGTYRQFVTYGNTGARSFQAAIGIGAPFGPIASGSAGADTAAFQTGIVISSVGVGIDIRGANAPPTLASLTLPIGATLGQGTSIGTRMTWGSAATNSPAIGISPATPFTSVMVNFNGSTAALDSRNFIPGTLVGIFTGINNLSTMVFDGTIQIPPIAFANGSGSSIQACSTANEGALQAINDSNTTTIGVTPGGFGTNHVMIRCNGTSWIVASP